MNKITIENQEIEIVFDNCETILVDQWAIKSMSFNTICDRYFWDNYHKEFERSTMMNDFVLSLDLSKPQNFHHQHRLIEQKTILEDGKECIKRIQNCDDITHIYINGICFGVPWKKKSKGNDKDLGIPEYSNEYQTNKNLTGKNGEPIINIRISMPDGEKGDNV